MNKTQKQKTKDPLFRIKYLGYHMSQLLEIFEYKDFVRFAKFHLCLKSNKLMKDPIWNTYTPEDIMVEFFAHKFIQDKTFKDQFEFELEFGKSEVDDFIKWADSEIAKDEEARLKTMSNSKDSI